MRIKRVIRVILLGGWFVVLAGAGAWSAPPADFAVTDIMVGGGGFVTIELKNKSGGNIPLSPALKEKVFLIIYINKLKRAEYKIKYLNPGLFKKRGVIRLRTNFRVQKPIIVRAVVNPLKVIPEQNFSNNRLEKKVAARNK